MLKVKHIVSGRSYCQSTERSEIFAYCDYSEEASGSGKHTVNMGDIECAKCIKIASFYGGK